MARRANQENGTRSRPGIVKVCGRFDLFVADAIAGFVPRGVVGFMAHRVVGCATARMVRFVTSGVVGFVPGSVLAFRVSAATAATGAVA